MKLTEKQLNCLELENKRTEYGFAKLRKRLRWIFTARDFCPICAKVTKWKTENVDTQYGFPIIQKYVCRVCESSISWGSVFS